MTTISERCNQIFDLCIENYHLHDSVDAAISLPYEEGSMDSFLYRKNWIDAVQWHLEDIIRDPKISPERALEIKRRIDKSNQDRTDLVEMIDSELIAQYSNVKILAGATLNTETPAWAIDRLSILALKIYHMRVEAERKEAEESHIIQCKNKLRTLLTQRTDLSTAIDQLISDIESGHKYIKSYKQMKMYNDPTLNPVLYGEKKK